MAVIFTLFLYCETDDSIFNFIEQNDKISCIRRVQQLRRFVTFWRETITESTDFDKTDQLTEAKDQYYQEVLRVRTNHTHTHTHTHTAPLIFDFSFLKHRIFKQTQRY